MEWRWPDPSAPAGHIHWLGGAQKELGPTSNAAVDPKGTTGGG